MDGMAAVQVGGTATFEHEAESKSDSGPDVSTPSGPKRSYWYSKE